MSLTESKISPAEIFSKQSGNKLQKEQISRFLCSLCSGILNTPVQAECGDRYCDGCFKSLFSDGCDKAKCRECDEIIENKLFLDKSCKKELCELRKKCGCGKLFSLDEYRTHSMNCPHAIVQCLDGCGQWLPAKDMSGHSKECTMRCVKCKYCSTVMLAAKLRPHYEGCVKFPLTVCPHCDSEFENQQKATMHIEYLCDLKDYPCYFCEEKSKRAAYVQHVEEQHKFQFTVEALRVAASLPSLVSRIERLEMQHATKLPDLEQKLAAASDVATNLKTEVGKMHQRIDQLKGEVAEQGKNSGQKDMLMLGKAPDLLDEPERDCQVVNQRSNVAPLGGRERDSNISQTLINAAPSGVKHADETIDSLQMRLKQLEADSSSHGMEITKLLSLLQSQEDAMVTQRMALDDLQLNLEMTKAKTTNGILIWRVDSLMRRISEADQGKVVSLYSPPFYTSPHGYRMCMRIYLNGDGSGRGTHLSAFFVMMQSEYDDLLPWPFMQKVTIYLLNQHSLNDPTSHISQSFLPDAHSSSFKKPIKDMNIASGFPKFAPRSVYHDKRFAANDTLYFKVRVSTENLPQD